MTEPIALIFAYGVTAAFLIGYAIGLLTARALITATAASPERNPSE